MHTYASMWEKKKIGIESVTDENGVTIEIIALR